MHVTLAARTFGAVLVVLGLAYGALSIYALLNVDEMAGVLQTMRATENKDFGFSSVRDWKESVQSNAWLFLIIGAGAAVCGVGILAKKEWARKCWLFASALVAFYVLFVGLSHGAWQPHIELLAFAAPSFALLIKKFERKSKVQSNSALLTDASRLLRCACGAAKRGR